MTKFAVFVLTAFGSLLPSVVCSQTPPPTADTNVIVPLGVGYRWEGILTTYHGSDSTLSSEFVTLTYEMSDHNERWYRLAYIRNGDTNTALYLLTNRKDGLWQRNADYVAPDSLSRVMTLVFKYPAVAGDDYTCGLELTMSVLATDTVVTVPAGTFHCICYLATDLSGEETSDTVLFLCPGVGWVRKVGYTGSSGPNWVWVLTKLVRS